MGRRVIACVAALALSIGVVLGTLSAQAASAACTPQASWGTSDGSLAGQIISLVNQHRSSLGLSQLQSNQGLSDSANWKSLNMAGLGYFGHVDLDGRSPSARAAACGYSGDFGENIYYASYRATAESVVAGWLNSAGHKQNIETRGWTVTGVGVAVSARSETFWTQEFGTGAGSVVTAPPPPAPSPVTPPASPPATPAAPASPPATPAAPPAAPTAPASPPSPPSSPS